MKLAFGVLIALVCFGIAVYYIMPTVPHFLSTDTATSFHSHYKQAIAFVAAALIFLVGGFFAQNGFKSQK